MAGLTRDVMFWALLAVLTACGPSAGGLDADTEDTSDGREIDAGVIDAETTQARGGALFHGDFDTNGSDQVALMELSERERVVLSLNAMSGGDIRGLDLSPDQTTLVAAGFHQGGDPFVLRRYPIEGGDGVDLYECPDENRDIENVQISPDGSLVAFLADGDLASSKSLYVVPLDGSAAARRVSPLPVSGSQDVDLLPMESRLEAPGFRRRSRREF